MSWGNRAKVGKVGQIIRPVQKFGWFVLAAVVMTLVAYEAARWEELS